MQEINHREEKKKKLIIHIGVGKTGSTAIQNSLVANEKLLREKKIFYCGFNFERTHLKENWMSEGRSLLLESFPSHIRRYGFSKVFDQLVNDTNTHNYETFIVSNESYSDLPDILSDLLFCAKIFFHEIIIASYIRNPQQWLESAYLQWGIKNKTYSGEIKKFSEWVFDASPNPYKNIIIIKNYAEEYLQIFNYDTIPDVTSHFFKKILLIKNKIILNNEKNNPSANSVEAFFRRVFNNKFEDPVESYELDLLTDGNVYFQDENKSDYHEYNSNGKIIEKFISNNYDSFSIINNLLIKNKNPSLNLKYNHKIKLELNEKTEILYLLKNIAHLYWKFYKMNNVNLPSSFARKHGGLVVPGSIRDSIKIKKDQPIYINWRVHKISFSIKEIGGTFIKIPALYDNILPISPDMFAQSKMLPGTPLGFKCLQNHIWEINPLDNYSDINVLTDTPYGPDGFFNATRMVNSVFFFNTRHK
jgi:hypothetical protein